jgi:hypothetical protein
MNQAQMESEIRAFVTLIGWALREKREGRDYYRDREAMNQNDLAIMHSVGVKP